MTLVIQYIQTLFAYLFEKKKSEEFLSIEIFWYNVCFSYEYWRGSKVFYLQGIVKMGPTYCLYINIWNSKNLVRLLSQKVFLNSKTPVTKYSYHMSLYVSFLKIVKMEC